MGTNLGRVAVAVAMVVLGAAGGAAAKGGGETKGQDRPVTVPEANPQRGGDQRIVMELHHANQNETTMAKMALDQATSPDVRDYAARLVADHAAADEKLLAYAERKNMNMDAIGHPTGALPHGALNMTDISASTAPAFNYDFANKMVAEHQKALDAATAAQKMARDPELKALIGEILPTLREHQAVARALELNEPPTPQPTVQRPGEPSGVSRTQTGVEDRPGMMR